ncbi:MAG: hypothetical protein ACTHL8_04570 [Burkholderiaceae bacterium]
MKHQEAHARPSPSSARTASGQPTATHGRGLDGVIHWLERVMPDLPQIGVAMLIVAGCAACGWLDLDVDDVTSQALQAAQQGSAPEVSGATAY